MPIQVWADASLSRETAGETAILGDRGAGVVRRVERVRAGEGAPDRPVAPFDRMEEALLARVSVSDNQLADLARRRSGRVVGALTKDGAVAPERVKTKDLAGAEAAGEAPRVEFTIE